MAWFTCAVHMPVRNHGGHMSTIRGLVLHHAVANGSLFDHFNSAASEVSAHFWVARDGRIEQYVDSEIVAWHGTATLNPNWHGVETEGCVTPPHAEPMTEAMVDGLARLYAEGMQRHGWADALANSASGRGFGFHRMAVATACPCDVRLNMRQEILSRATGAQPPPVQESDEDMDARIVTNPNNQGKALLDLATGEYKGLSREMYEYFNAQGVKEATGLTPAQWSKLKQTGTL